MIIDAEEAIYHRENPNNTYITATGNPIKYDGITEDGKPFSGNSKPAGIAAVQEKKGL
ncbi:hypothetical protein [Cedecea sp. NFIX57]|uniref:hypothetical protein n=1 Tax=Cedecea sp. NFIX57 TaxID=1566286 RepID=UPI000A0C39B5|nr:hypothetical protein [Cedecea sp. NFIX57]SMG62049.1 hypothetical protein SAMN03159353_11111 [Cedecea sp. NFIX57]